MVSNTASYEKLWYCQVTVIDHNQQPGGKLLHKYHEGFLTPLWINQLEFQNCYWWNWLFNGFDLTKLETKVT